MPTVASRLVIIAASAAVASSAGAQVSVWGLSTQGDRLVSFAPGDTATYTNDFNVSGLQADESLQSIDFRPSTGELYAISNQNRLYTVDTTTGVATQRTSQNAVPFAITGNSGIDFDNVSDSLRVVSSSGQNYRINPDTGSFDFDDGAAYAPDPAFRYAAGDTNFGTNPNVFSAAYGGNSYGSLSSQNTLYTLGRNSSGETSLFRQGSIGGNPFSANTGELTTLGTLSNTYSNDLMGFDIYTDINGNDTAYFSGSTGTGDSSDFYSLDLNSGAETSLGTVGGPIRGSSLGLRDIAVIPAPSAAAALISFGVLALRRKR